MTSIYDKPWKELTSGERSRRVKGNKARRALAALDDLPQITVQNCKTCYRGEGIAWTGQEDVYIDACKRCTDDPVKAAAFKLECDFWDKHYKESE